MATLGAVTVDILRGNTTPVRTRVETWHVPGRTGIGAQLMGSNESAFAYEGVVYAATATAETTLAAVAALQGTVITIVDDHSQSRANCLVTSVDIPDRRAVVHNGTAKVRAVVHVSGVRVGS